MSEANMENLSAAMDGTLSREELRFLLRRLDHDQTLREVWARYHVAADSLRHQLPTVASSGFASRVMQIIESEEVSTQATPHRRDWLRLSVGGAIAASVAVAALMVSQPTAPDAAHSPRLANVNAARQGALPPADADTTHATSNMLAAVPPSLSPYSASDLSQRASVTLGDMSDNPLFQRYPVSNAQGYSSKGYKTLTQRDGSYLLLIDTPQAKAQGSVYPATAAGR